MAKTGEKCERKGNYKGECERKKHHETAYFTVGDTFTPCATCGGLGAPGGAVMNWQWTSG